MRQLLEMVAAKAEVGVLTGALSETGDFGERYPDYFWSYDAEVQGEDEFVPLYAVHVWIESPDEERELDFYVYNTGPETDEEGLLSGTSGQSTGRSSGNSTGQTSGRSGSRSSGRSGGLFK